MSTVSAVLVSLLVLAVIAIAATLALTNLRDSVDSVNKVTTVPVNATTGTITTTGAYITGTENFRNCALTIACAINNTGTPSHCINAANYTISGCKITNTSADYSNIAWKVTGSYTYSEPNSGYIASNITGGVTNFTKNVPTFFTLLGVVVLILIIAIVIVAVSRFQTGEPISSGGRGGMSEQI